MVTRWLMPGIAAVASLMVPLVTLYLVSSSSPETLQSPQMAVSAAQAGMLFIWPAMAGIGAADATLAARPQVRSVVESLPPSSRIRLAARRICEPLVGMSVGLALAVGVAVAIAQANSGQAPVKVLVAMPVAIAGGLAFCSLGWVLGGLARSWFVPPCLAVALYLVNTFEWFGARRLYAFFMPGGRWSIVVHPAPTMYVVFLAFFVAVTGVLTLAPTTPGTSPRTTVAWFICIAAVLASGLFIWTRGDINTSSWNLDDVSTWPCSTVGLSGTVCTPPEQERDLASLASDLAPLDSRLTQLDDQLANRTWMPLEVLTANPTGDPEPYLTYSMLLGYPYSEHDQLGAIAEGFAVPCVTKGDATGNEALIERASYLSYVIQVWLNPEDTDADFIAQSWGIELPVTLDAAQSAYAELIECTQR